MNFRQKDLTYENTNFLSALLFVSVKKSTRARNQANIGALFVRWLKSKKMLHQKRVPERILMRLEKAYPGQKISFCFFQKIGAASIGETLICFFPLEERGGEPFVLPTFPQVNIAHHRRTFRRPILVGENLIIGGKRPPKGRHHFSPILG